MRIFIWISIIALGSTITLTGWTPTFLLDEVPLFFDSSVIFWPERTLRLMWSTRFSTDNIQQKHRWILGRPVIANLMSNVLHRRQLSAVFDVSIYKFRLFVETDDAGISRNHGFNQNKIFTKKEKRRESREGHWSFPIPAFGSWKEKVVTNLSRTRSSLSHRKIYWEGLWSISRIFGFDSKWRHIEFLKV